MHSQNEFFSRGAVQRIWDAGLVPHERKQFGDWGEEYARRYLEGLGYAILESNYRGRHGEIDLVAREGGCLVFVEVKSRRTGAFGRPEESVTEAKQQKMVQAALEYMQEKEIEDGEWRIDVVGREAGGARPRVRLVRNAVAWGEGMDYRGEM